ncbi:transmembrane protein 116-like isoform X2 [Acropora palmata]|uniref:transmembrane protein 116-like isoform X2 n=1 Tax=Acropora palmata TaxID=6131 RepID=UPI003DA17228
MLENSTPAFVMNHTSSSASWEIECTLSDEESRKPSIIAIIHVVTSSLSILGSSSVLLYALVKRSIRSPAVHPLFHLALADLILGSLWLIGALIWFQSHRKMCFYLDVLGEIAHLASFFLTINYALTAFFGLWGKRNNINSLQFSSDDATSKLNLWLARMGYIVCCCLLLFDRPKVRKDGAIWLSYGSIALTTAISISMVTLVVVYFMVLKVFRKAVVYSGRFTDLQRANIDAIRNRIFLYILVFLVCWSPALVVASYDIAPKFNLRVKSSFSLFVIQGLTAPMQGFLNCIVYGWTRKSFREASETRAPLLDSADRSFFRSRRLLYGTASVRSL